MSQPIGFRLGLGWSGWLAVLISLGLVIAIATVISVVLLGLAVVLLPLMLASALVYYLFPGLRDRRRWGRAPNDADVIDGEYRVVNPDQLERNPSSEGQP